MAESPDGEDIEGYLQAISFQNFAGFENQATALTGSPIDRLERRTATGETLLTDAVLDALDTLIIISFDTKRTGQTVTPPEIESLRGFLGRADTMLFICPHHDIGDTGSRQGDAALERQTAVPEEALDVKSLRRSRSPFLLAFAGGVLVSGRA